MGRRAKNSILPTLLLVILSVTSADSDVPRLRHARNDDVSLTSLAVTVQQQAAMITSLQADLAAEKAKTAAIKTDVEDLKAKASSAGKNVAFTAHFSADNGTDGVPIGNNAPLQFDTVPVNIGNGYDHQFGTFTAPVAGTYCFFVTMMGAGVHGYSVLHLVKDRSNVILDVIFSYDHNDQGSGLVTSHLGAGERVWVEHAVGDAVRGSWYTYFTGFLINAD